jgi:hypothetical protein
MAGLSDRKDNTAAIRRGRDIFERLARAIDRGEGAADVLERVALGHA